jgi:hypothetical protein
VKLPRQIYMRYSQTRLTQKKSDFGREAPFPIQNLSRPPGSGVLHKQANNMVGKKRTPLPKKLNDLRRISQVGPVCLSSVGSGAGLAEKARAQEPCVPRRSRRFRTRMAKDWGRESG